VPEPEWAERFDDDDSTSPFPVITSPQQHSVPPAMTHTPPTTAGGGFEADAGFSESAFGEESAFMPVGTSQSWAAASVPAAYQVPSAGQQAPSAALGFEEQVFGDEGAAKEQQELATVHAALQGATPQPEAYVQVVPHSASISSDEAGPPPFVEAVAPGSPGPLHPQPSPPPPPPYEEAVSLQTATQQLPPPPSYEEAVGQQSPPPPPPYEEAITLHPPVTSPEAAPPPPSYEEAVQHASPVGAGLVAQASTAARSTDGSPSQLPPAYEEALDHPPAGGAAPAASTAKAPPLRRPPPPPPKPRGLPAEEVQQPPQAAPATTAQSAEGGQHQFSSAIQLKGDEPGDVQPAEVVVDQGASGMPQFIDPRISSASQLCVEVGE
jgi:hypothetical protein